MKKRIIRLICLVEAMCIILPLGGCAGKKATASENSCPAQSSAPQATVTPKAPESDHATAKSGTPLSPQEIADILDTLSAGDGEIVFTA